jgi:hypothetical protein
MQSDKKSNKNEEYFNIEDLTLQDAIDGGVMEDKISVKRITFWTVILTVIVIILCAIAFNLYKYFKFEQQFQQAVKTEYRELNNLRQNAFHILETKDVVDEEAGFFRIPIDSAMTLIVRDYKEN